MKYTIKAENYRIKTIFLLEKSKSICVMKEDKNIYKIYDAIALR